MLKMKIRSQPFMMQLKMVSDGLFCNFLRFKDLISNSHKFIYIDRFSTAGNGDFIRVLVKNGADLGMKDNEGKTALKYADQWNSKFDFKQKY